jgi:hypothetical protein
MLMVLAIALLVTLAGCGRTEAQRLRNAADAYATAVDLAADARQAGLIDDAEARRIETYRRTARSALDAWRDAYARRAGPRGSFEAAFCAALDELRAVCLESQ